MKNFSSQCKDLNAASLQNIYGSTAQRPYHIPNVACAKEDCNRAVTYQPAQARKSGEKFRDSLLRCGLQSGTHFL